MIQVLADNIKVKKQPGKEQPIYEQIRSQIHDMVISGELSPGQQLPGISQISEKLNVNYRTVKSAFELLEKDGILTCHPNKRPVVVGLQNENLKMNQALCFAFLRMAGDDFFVSTSVGIKKYTEENDIDCIFIDALNDHKRVIDAIMHPGNTVDGIILAPYETPQYYKAISAALRKNTHIVFLDRVLPNINVSAVSADHFMGAYLATQHLLDKHSLPVYFIGNTLEPSSCRERVAGWRSAMHSYGFAACSSHLVEIGFEDNQSSDKIVDDFQAKVKAAGNFFESHQEKIYTVLASNDYMAQAVYVAAEEKGFKVGKDVFIVGFGNLPMASRLDVPLTTVNQYYQQVGYEAAKSLFEKITGTMPKPVQRVLPVDLVVRKSSIATD